ncbi:MAG: DNA polymerase III subunit alpha, partial [Bacteroidota bacterium]
DIDYSWRDRDDVLDYLLKRYRSDHAVLLATYQRFQPRSAIRELGKAFGLPKKEIDILTTLGLEAVSTDPVSEQVLEAARLIQGFPDHLSIHAGGVLIAEAPIHSYTATDLPPKGMPISHFDMHVAEEIGLHKFDVLSQRGLGHIREAVDIIQAEYGKSIDIHDVQTFKRDPEVQRLMKLGETVGCFYVESPAMRGLLRKLKCDHYRTLVAASSVIRPGVARSGMMRSFIERHNGQPFTYLHPKMAELLGETYGIMVYQEDVLKVVHGFAGLDLADADLLRRAMSGKTRGKAAFERIKTNFMTACAERGYAQADTEEVWRQIESFAGYSFSKAHSASYAVESMQSLYLKAHYPLAFMTAVINNFGGFYSTEFYLHEARRWGAQVHAPCVNQSSYHTRLTGQDIYLGFIHIKGLDHDLAQAIERERMAEGDFKDLGDFRFRLDAREPQLKLLVRVGGFRFTGESKTSLLWKSRLGRSNGRAPQRETLFAVETTVTVEVPELPASALEDAYDEMELLGFPLCSPFELLEKPPSGVISAKDLPQHRGKVVCMAGYFICAKTTTTVKGERMQFANFIDPAGDFFDVTIFPPEVKQYPLRGKGVYLLTGMVAEEFGVFSMELMVMEKFRYRVGETGDRANGSD